MGKLAIGGQWATCIQAVIQFMCATPCRMVQNLTAVQLHHSTEPLTVCFPPERVPPMAAHPCSLWFGQSAMRRNPAEHLIIRIRWDGWVETMFAGFYCKHPHIIMQWEHFLSWNQEKRFPVGFPVGICTNKSNLWSNVQIFDHSCISCMVVQNALVSVRWPLCSTEK